MKGYETELLGLIGAAEEDHRITGFEWAGERYLDDYGIAYRNARAFGLRKLTDYQVSYVGRVYFTTSETAADRCIAHNPLVWAKNLWRPLKSRRNCRMSRFLIWLTYKNWGKRPQRILCKIQAGCLQRQKGCCKIVKSASGFSSIRDGFCETGGSGGQSFYRAGEAG